MPASEMEQTDAFDVATGDELLRSTRCAICDAPAPAEELYQATLTPDAFSAAVFSARRLPDRVHYRVVRCQVCDLVRSDPVLDPSALSRLYESSTFDYGQELDSLRRTYGRALRSVAELAPEQRGLLDVGAGNGFVLEVARELGWTEVWGVEPSLDARAQARPDIRERIITDIMRPGLLEPGSLSAVTLFQVLDHLPDPVSTLRECQRLLKPGGVVLAFNHNVGSWSARLLRDRSPIIDVEHTYLYSPHTMRRLFERAGFEVTTVRPVRNTYSTRYLTRLLPLPSQIKQPLLAALQRSRLGQATLTVPLGNLCLLARRPG